MERALVALVAATLASLLYDWVDRRQKVECFAREIRHPAPARPGLRRSCIQNSGTQENGII